MIYGGSGFDDLAETVRNTTEDLRPHRSEFDSIVVRGLSGIVVGSAVSLRLRKPLVVVRKPCELEDNNSHASGLVENDRRVGRRYVWIDDFVSSGTTRVEVWRGIAYSANADAKMALEYQYRTRLLSPGELCAAVNGCDAACKTQYQNCDHCQNGVYDPAKCYCRTNTICGFGHWQS